MKSIRLKILIVFIPVLVLVLIIPLVRGYTNAASWLYVQSPCPDKIDYLCSFAGNPRRERYALQLYRRYTPIWIASTINKDEFLRWAEQNGLDTDKIIVTDKCESTLDEIRFIKSQIASCSSSTVSSLAFVSSPLQMRRILIYNALINRNDRFIIYPLPVPLEQDGLSHEVIKEWRKNKGVRDMVFLELLKIFGGFVSTIPFFWPMVKC